MSDSPAVVRVTLLCHAATAAMRAGRFPDPDDPLDARSQADLGHVSFRPGTLHRRCTSPATRALATAAALGLDARPEPLLDDAASGAWAGRSIDELAAADPARLAAWFDSPDAAPPGGEAFASVLARVARWLGAQSEGPGMVAVTHPAVIRAAVVLALDAPPSAARQVDVQPLTVTRLSGRPGHWRLACLNVPLGRIAD